MKSFSKSLAKKCLCSLAVCSFLLVSNTPFAKAETKPVAIIALNSIDHLMDDANFIGSLMGQPQIADQMKPQVDAFTQGLDKSKPIGLVVNLGDMGPSGALCLPATDLKQLLAMGAMFGIAVEDKGDGNLEINAQGQTLFAKQSDGWAFVSMMPAMLEGMPDDPGEILGKLTAEYDLGIEAYIQNIPQQYRDIAIEQLQAGMEAGLQKQSGESDQQFEARKNVTNVQIEQIKNAINDLDELTLGLAIDGDNQRALVDLIYTAVPGSKLAEQVEMNSDTKTNFAGFYQPDAAMMLSFASKVAEADIAQMQQMFEAIRKQVHTGIEEETDQATDEEREIIKSAVDDFLDAFLATVKEGAIDGGAVLNLAPNAATFVAGGMVGDPSKVESGLKKLAELGEKKSDEFPGISWNADSHSGVNFHTMSIPIPAGEDKPRQLFGDAVDIAVGIGQKSVYFSLGRGAIEAAKEIIDTSVASPNKSVAPMELTFAMQQIMEVVASMAEGPEKSKIEMIANMLASSADGRDHVRVVVQMIPNGARTRIEVEEGVLRSIGMAAMQAQMEAAGAGAGGF